MPVEPTGTSAFTLKTQAATDASSTSTRSISGERRSSTDIKLYMDGAQISSNATADSGTFVSIKIAQGGYIRNNTPSFISHVGYQEQFVTWGAKLPNSSDHALFDQIIQTALAGLGFT